MCLPPALGKNPLQGGRRRRKRKGRRRTKAFLCLALLLHSLIYATFIPIPFCLFALSLGVALGMGGKRSGKERRRVEKKLCRLNPSQEKLLERGETAVAFVPACA